MAYQKINALTRRDLLHNQHEYTSTLKNFRLEVKKVFFEKYFLFDSGVPGGGKPGR